MKWVSVMINPFHLDGVIAALDAIGVSRLTMTEVQRCCEQPRYAYDAEDEEHGPKLVPHVRLDIALADEQLRQVIDTVLRATRTELAGDEKIMVAKLESAVRIRTGETGEAAL